MSEVPGDFFKDCGCGCDLEVTLEGHGTRTDAQERLTQTFGHAFGAMVSRPRQRAVPVWWRVVMPPVGGPKGCRLAERSASRDTPLTRTRTTLSTAQASDASSAGSSSPSNPLGYTASPPAAHKVTSGPAGYTHHCSSPGSPRPGERSASCDTPSHAHTLSTAQASDASSAGFSSPSNPLAYTASPPAAHKVISGLAGAHAPLLLPPSPPPAAALSARGPVPPAPRLPPFPSPLPPQVWDRKHCRRSQDLSAAIEARQGNPPPRRSCGPRCTAVGASPSPESAATTGKQCSPADHARVAQEVSGELPSPPCTRPRSTHRHRLLRRHRLRSSLHSRMPPPPRFA